MEQLPMTESVLVIAEAGVNHDGDVRKALDLVDAAVGAGADIVKFQTFSVEDLATIHAPIARYQSASTSGEESQLSMLRELSLHDDDWRSVANRCNGKDIEFLSTGFDSKSLDLLLGVGMTRIKIPSGEITNLPLLRYVSRLGLPVIMSTGMADLSEVEAALAVLRAENADVPEVCVLHCTSQYPAPPESVNLRAMVTMREEFDVAVGYSDHTQGWEVAVSAVALGASVIEKHITLDSKAPGPDHAASLEPDEFAQMVRSIRLTEIALGDGTKAPDPVEADVKAVARRSIVARRHIRKGEYMTSDDLAVKRPAAGLSPMLWDSVVGTRAIRDFEPDECVEL